MFEPRPEMINRRVEILSPASCLQNSNWLFQESNATKWTQKENKLFENALAFFDKETPDRWVQVAAMIPGKSIGDVMKQYYELVEDVSDIEAGLTRIPEEDYTYPFTLELVNDSSNNMKQDLCGSINFYSHGGKKSCLSAPSSDLEKKKGVPWTEQEHRQFLMGLKKHGKGDWRNISRNCVTTRTPTQVASHAQKYFIRQQHCYGEGKKDSNSNTNNTSKRRSSIHDITTANLSDSNLPLRDGKNAASTLPQNHGLKWENGNMFYMAPICGISLYGPNYNYKMQEPKLVGGTIHGSQIRP